MKIFFRILIKLLRKQDGVCKRLAAHGMVWRGWARKPLHPKHLFDDDRNTLLHEQFRPGIVFLDIGSANGTDCLNALRAGAARAEGVEIDARSLELAAMRANDANLPANFQHADLESGTLPFADSTFDVINFTNVLEHLVNRIQILKEMRRVLKPDGVAVISAPNCETPWKKFQRRYGMDSRDDEDHKIEYTPACLSQELEAAGLTLASPLYPIIPSWPWNGILATAAILSPAMYRWTQRMKYQRARRDPKCSIGWILLVR